MVSFYLVCYSMMFVINYANDTLKKVRNDSELRQYFGTVTILIIALQS